MKLLKIFWKTLDNLIYNDLIEISGYIAYSTLLAFFPFCLFLVTVASFFGETQIAKDFLEQIYWIMPTNIVEVISPIVEETIGKPRGGVMTIAVFGMIWVAGSGIEAFRVGLNSAHSLKETRSFYFRKAQALGFIIAATITIMLISIMIIIAPIAIDFTEKFIPIPIDLIIKLNITRYFIAIIILVMTLSCFYKYLPNHHIKWRKCLPGAIFSTVIWVLVANLFSVILKSLVNYNITYGSLGGVVAALLFFHITAIIFIYGAEFNVYILPELRKKK
jgi:membrane protein